MKRLQFFQEYEDPGNSKLCCAFLALGHICPSILPNPCPTELNTQGNVMEHRLGLYNGVSLHEERIRLGYNSETVLTGSHAGWNCHLTLKPEGDRPEGIPELEDSFKEGVRNYPFSLEGDDYSAPGHIQISCPTKDLRTCCQALEIVLELAGLPSSEVLPDIRTGQRKQKVTLKQDPSISLPTREVQQVDMLSGYGTQFTKNEDCLQSRLFSGLGPEFDDPFPKVEPHHACLQEGNFREM